jgi:hypothetical protein
MTTSTGNPLVDAWLAGAVADAERRGLQDLKPLLETLARSTAALRDAHVRVSDPATPPAREPHDA